MIVFMFFVFFFKQKTAYEMRISDWSSDVCSSDLEMIDQPRLLGMDAPAAESLEIDLLADRHRDEARARHRHDRALLHHREVRAAAEPGRRPERGVERGRRPGRVAHPPEQIGRAHV